MATFAVKTHHLSFGNMAAVVNEVTGDGTTRTWETGLSNVSKLSITDVGSYLSIVLIKGRFSS